MRLKLKKLIPVFLTFTFLSSLSMIPANAVTDDDYYCGNYPLGSFTVVSNVVTANNGLCSGLVNIPSGVTSIGDGAFLGNTSITSVTIPNTVTSIGSEAFKNSTRLASVTFGNSVTSIGTYAFYNNALTSVSIPNSVTTIGDQAFQQNTSLTSVTLGNSVSSIGTYSFSTESLTSVTFLGNAPATVSNVAFYKFGADATANVLYNATGFPADGSRWNRLTIQRIANCSTSGYFIIYNNVITGNTSCVGSVEIPSGVTSIGMDAFLDNTSITSVTIPNSVTFIGINAFRNATSLTDVTIPDSVITISGGAFRNTRFSSVTLGNSVTTIGVRAFGDSRLTSVTIPNSVSTIASSAFQSITTLAFVTFLGNAPATVGANAFDGVPTGTPANVAYNATGFPTNGSTWNGLIISYGSAPAGDSDSTTATVITPTVVKTADVVFNLKNKKYLSKNALKTKLSKSKSFKRVPEDLYKYSIFKASKKTCVINENYVTGLKKTGTCDLYTTRTTTKGVKYKYWVQINYTK